MEIGRQHDGRCEDRTGQASAPGLVAPRFEQFRLIKIRKHSYKVTNKIVSVRGIPYFCNRKFDRT